MDSPVVVVVVIVAVGCVVVVAVVVVVVVVVVVIVVVSESSAESGIRVTKLFAMARINTQNSSILVDIEYRTLSVCIKITIGLG